METLAVKQYHGPSHTSFSYYNETSNYPLFYCNSLTCLLHWQIHLPLHFHCVLSHFHPSYWHPQIPAVETTTTKKYIWKEVKDRPAWTPNVFFLCFCNAISNAFELHFCSYKQYVFQRFTSFVGCDWRSLKNNCFQQRLIFYKTPVNYHQCLLRSCTAG